MVYGIVCNITGTQTQNNVPMVTKYVMQHHMYKLVQYNTIIV